MGSNDAPLKQQGPGTALEGSPASSVKNSGVIRKEDRVGAEALAEGDAAFEHGDADAAAAIYVRALEHLRAAPPTSQAEAYVRLGRVNRIRKRSAGSLHCLERALCCVPGFVPALEELVLLHAEWEEWKEVAQCEKALFGALEPSRRVLALLRSGDRWWRMAGDRRRASSRYREAARIDPHHEGARARLRSLEATEARANELEALRRAAEGSQNPARRASLWLELGHAYWNELRQFDDAIGAFEAAFESDPALLEAMEWLLRALVTRRRWAQLEACWDRLADAKTPSEIAARALVRDALGLVPTEATKATPRHDTVPWSERRPDRG